MTRLAFAATPISGVSVVTRTRFRDQRGHFARLFCPTELACAGWSGPIAQINESTTKLRGGVRGMHFQLAPHADWKLVSCVSGAVFDAALDIRAGSPTLLAWHGETLSADNGRALLIPPGCAHGFQALSDEVTLIYCHSHGYAPEADAGVNPLDPSAAIAWPLPIGDMSDRDRDRPFLAEDFGGISF